jgi:hypothetical protein
MISRVVKRKFWRLKFKCFMFHLFTVILPVVLYGCETWSLTLREERRQGV